MKEIKYYKLSDVKYELYYNLKPTGVYIIRSTAGYNHFASWAINYGGKNISSGLTFNEAKSQSKSVLIDIVTKAWLARNDR